MRLKQQILGRISPGIIYREVPKAPVYPIPEQLKSMDFVPTEPGNKGQWSLSSTKMSKEQISAADEVGAWSEHGLKKNAKYLSWPKFNLLPSDIKKELLSKYDEYSIRTGKQQSSDSYIIVIDIDNDDGRAQEYLLRMMNVLPETFIRSTPSGGYHIFYKIPCDEFSDKKRLDLRQYGLNIEVLNGVLTKEIGPNRNNLNNNPIHIAQMPQFKEQLNQLISDMVNESLNIFKPREVLGDFTPVPNPVDISWEEMEEILEKHYLPVYIRPELNGLRDTNILFATMGLLKRYYSKDICIRVLNWINDVAEYQKIGSEADIRNYDFSTVDKLGIPTLVDPTGGKYNISFQDFVDEIIPPATFSVGVSGDEGRKFLENNPMEISKKLEEVFEILVPGNGKLASLMWASAVATVKGQPNIVTILGNPGEGKTVLMEYVLKFIPDNYIIRLNDVTIPALMTDTHELGNDYLDKKIVYLGDLGASNAWEDSADARKVLRILLTDGHWARKKHTKMDVAGSRVAKDAVILEELNGKPAMWFTTVKEDGDDQDKDRSIIATTNLSKEKDIIYLIQHKDKDSRTGRKIRRILEEYVPVFQSVFQALIDSDEEVIIPWDISELEFRFRDSSRLVNITSLLGLINQNHRNRYGPYILPSDNDLLDVLTMMEKSGSELNERIMKNLRIMWKKFGTNEFTRADAMALDGFTDVYGKSDRLAAKLLTPAINAGFIQQVDGGNGRAIIYEFFDEPTHNISVRNIPKYDMEMLKYEYGDHEITTPN